MWKIKDIKDKVSRTKYLEDISEIIRNSFPCTRGCKTKLAKFALCVFLF
jgi:hypothetical protein